MKKYYCFLLCALLCAAVLNAQNIDSGETGQCSWTLTGPEPDLLLIISGQGAMEDYPSESAPWYSYRTYIETLCINNSVTYIGEKAFDGFPVLTSVICMQDEPPIVSANGFNDINLAAIVLYVAADYLSLYRDAAVWKEFGSIEPIGDSVTGGTTGTLTWKIVNDVLTISGIGDMPDYAYNTIPWYDYRSSFHTVIIDEGVTGIGNLAFLEHAGLTSVSIPGTVSRIGMIAFLNCVHLPSIVIPASVTFIGDAALSNCHSLTSISVAPGNPAFSSDDGVLFNQNRTMLVAYPCGKPENYIIPETVTAIGKNAFSGYLKLTSITIPASVISMNEWAFSNCTNLTAVSLPASLTDIGHGVFSMCSNLSEIVNANPEPQAVVEETFLDVDFNVCILRVPAASVDAYKDADVWKEFKNIVALEAEATVITVELDRKVIYLLNGSTATLTATISGVNDDLDSVLWDHSGSNVVTFEYICSAAITIPSSDEWIDSQVIHECEGTITTLKQGLSVITISVFENEAACSVTVIQPGTTTIEGVVNNAGNGNLRMKLYMDAEQPEEPVRLRE